MVQRFIPEMTFKVTSQSNSDNFNTNFLTAPSSDRNLMNVTNQPTLHIHYIQNDIALDVPYNFHPVYTVLYIIELLFKSLLVESSYNLSISIINAELLKCSYGDVLKEV